MSASSAITTQPTNPAISSVSSATNESKKYSSCCYRGYHWSHLITIPGALISGGGAAYAAYTASYHFAGAFCFGSVSSSFGAVVASWLAPRNNLETNVDRLSSLNKDVGEQNDTLEKNLEKLEARATTVTGSVHAAGVIIEKTSAEMTSQNSEIMKELQQAKQREADLKKLLVKYQTALQELSTQVKGLSNISNSLETSGQDLEEAGANLSVHIQNIGIASGVVSREKDELELATAQFDKLNDTFRQRIDLLSSTLTAMQESNLAMAERIDELEKIETDMTDTKALIEGLVEKIEIISQAINTKFEHMDEAWEAADLVKALADISSVSSKVLGSSK